MALGLNLTFLRSTGLLRLQLEDLSFTYSQFKRVELKKVQNSSTLARRMIILKFLKNKDIRGTSFPLISLFIRPFQILLS